jgi:hypothetical protein
MGASSKNIEAIRSDGPNLPKLTTNRVFEQDNQAIIT